jgi:hypothetical protein
MFLFKAKSKAGSDLSQLFFLEHVHTVQGMLPTDDSDWKALWDRSVRASGFEKL